MTSKRVLIVEDHPDIAFILEALCRNEGCIVTCVEDGQAALDVLAQERFDLAFVDILLPRLDGTAFTKIVRAWDQEPRMPIVGITAALRSQPGTDSITEGMDQVISKPFRACEIRKAIERHCG